MRELANRIKYRAVPNWLMRRYKEWLSPRLGLSIWLMQDIGVAYIATPKAASSAIRNMIRDREAARLFPEDRRPPGRLRRQVEKRIKHTVAPARAAELCRDYFVFSIARNPLTRLYSCYRDKVVNAAARQRSNTLRPYGIRFGMSFDEFVERVAAIPDRFSDQHFRSQHTFLAHEGRLLVDHLGKLEHFERDWQPLAERFNLTLPMQRHRVSGPPVTAAALPMTRRSAEIAIERYCTDIELLGYEAEVDQVLEQLPRA